MRFKFYLIQNCIMFEIVPLYPTWSYIYEKRYSKPRIDWIRRPTTANYRSGMLSASTPLSALQRVAYSRARHKSLNTRDRKDWMCLLTSRPQLLSASTFRRTKFRCLSYIWFQRRDDFVINRPYCTFCLALSSLSYLQLQLLFCRTEWGNFIVTD